MLLQFVKSHPRYFGSVALLLAANALLTTLVAANPFWTGHAVAHTELLFTTNSLSPTQFLPLDYKSRITVARGITAVTGMSSAAAWVAGTQRPSAVIVLDKPAVPAVFPDLQVKPQEMAEWQHSFSGVLLSEHLAERLHLHAGDRVDLSIIDRGILTPVSVPLAGSFGSSSIFACEFCMLIGAEFVRERFVSYRGVVSGYISRVAPGLDNARVASVLDSTFQHDAIPTSSGAFSISQGAFLHQLLDLKLYALGALALAVFACAAAPMCATVLMAQRLRGVYATLLLLGMPVARFWLRLGAVVVAAGAALSLMVSMTAGVLGGQGDHLIDWLQIEYPVRGVLSALGVTILLCTALWVTAFLTLRGIRSQSAAYELESL